MSQICLLELIRENKILRFLLKKIYIQYSYIVLKWVVVKGVRGHLSLELQYLVLLRQLRKNNLR